MRHDSNSWESLRRSEHAFTLVELLIVVLVIGVLMGVAIPTYLGARERAHDNTAKSNLNTAEKTAVGVFMEHGEFPSREVLLGELPLLEPSITWIAHNVSSTGPLEVSIDDDLDGAELVMAAMSRSGTCFWVRVNASDSPRGYVEDAAECKAQHYEGQPGQGWFRRHNPS